MEQSVENMIYNRMKKAKRGVAFFTSDFAVYGNNKTCNKALERLAKQDKIMRKSLTN